MSGERWFTANYEFFKRLTLENIMFPGTHDSGMSELTHGPAIIGPFTKTQNYNIHDQIILAGARYIDLRPAVAVDLITKDIYAAHWTYISGQQPGDHFIGMTGQKFSDICDNIASALPQLAENEIVFIELSHAIYLQFAVLDYPDQQMVAKTLGSNWQKIIVQKLLDAIGPFIYRWNATSEDNLLKFRPNRIFTDANGQPTSGAKVILWCSDSSLAECGFDQTNGLFNKNNVPYYNSWDDGSSDDPNQVIEILEASLEKYAQAPPPKNPYFLSWHCTTQADMRLPHPLYELASKLNEDFKSTILGWISMKVIQKTAFPTFVSWDFAVEFEAPENMVMTCIQATVIANKPTESAGEDQPTAIT